MKQIVRPKQPVNGTAAQRAAAEGADADAAGTKEEPLRQEPWWRTHDRMCFESRAEATEEMFGKDAAGEPRLEPADSVLQAHTRQMDCTARVPRARRS